MISYLRQQKRMANKQYQQSKKTLSYSKNSIKKAGRAIRKGEHTEKDIAVVQDFRAAHAYPLHIVANFVSKQAVKVYPNASIARRLKRLPTITDKLSRSTLDGKTENALDLLRMGDIGGCRVIVDTPEQVQAVRDNIITALQGRAKHTLVREKNYINTPRDSGYRGIHLVVKALGKQKDHAHSGYQIEIQIRTMIQHGWATSVEIIDLLVGTALKTDYYNSKHQQWKRLFYQLSVFLSWFDSEQTDYKPQGVKNLTDEILHLADALQVQETLSSVMTAFSDQEIIGMSKQYQYVLLTLRAADGGKIKGGASFYDEESQAITAYNAAEQQYANAVLVDAKDIEVLKTAYPNYFLETRQFLGLLDKVRKVNSLSSELSV